MDVDVLAKDGHLAVAATYVAASLLAGLGAVWASSVCARLLFGRGKS